MFARNRIKDIAPRKLTCISITPAVPEDITDALRFAKHNRINGLPNRHLRVAVIIIGNRRHAGVTLSTDARGRFD